MQIVIPSFTYSPYVVLRLFFFFTDVDFLFILRKEDTWLVWKLIRSLVHLKSLFLNSTCKYVMSINLEIAEELLLCVITQSVGFFAAGLEYEEKPKSCPKAIPWWPTKGGSEKRHFPGHIPCPFSLEQTSTYDLFAMIQGFKAVSLSLLDHHLSLPIDKLSTYKFWSLLGSLLNFPFHILCQQLPRGRKKTSPYPSFKKSNFHSASSNPLSRPTNVYYIIRGAMLWWCSTAHVHVHHQSYILLICLWV